MIIYGTHRHIKENIPGTSTPVSTYIFNIKETDNDVVFICTYDSIRTSLYESNCQDNDNFNILVDIFNTLLKTYKNIFVKEYTGQQISARCEHVIIETRFDADDVHKSWSCMPKEVRIRNGKFYIYWAIREIPLEFDIQLDSVSDDISNSTHTIHIGNKNVYEFKVPSQEKQQQQQKEKQHQQQKEKQHQQQKEEQQQQQKEEQQPIVNKDKIQYITNNTNDALNEFSQNFKEFSFDEVQPLNDTEVVKLRSSRIIPATLERKKRDRQRVEEARLRAKLAVYRAEKAIQRYIARYGNIDDLESSDGEETDASVDTDFD